MRAVGILIAASTFVVSCGGATAGESGATDTSTGGVGGSVAGSAGGVGGSGVSSAGAAAMSGMSPAGGSSGSAGGSTGSAGGEVVPPTQAALEQFQSHGCDVPTVTRLADGPGFVGRITGWQESLGTIAFDESGARFDTGIGAWWSIGGVPDESFYYYGDGFEADPPGSVLGVAGPFSTTIAGLDVSNATFTGDTISISGQDLAVYRTTADGHLLALRLDSFSYGGPATCVSGVLGAFTYWLIPFGNGSFGDFTHR